MLNSKTITLTPPIASRVKPKLVICRSGMRSRLTLKPTNERNVEAEESAAATMPATSNAPKKVGTKWVAAQIKTNVNAMS